MIQDTLDTLDTLKPHMCMRARACTKNTVSKVSYVSNKREVIEIIDRFLRHFPRHPLDTSAGRKPLKYSEAAA